MNAPERVAVVTGAGSGIGRQVALSLLAGSWLVVLAGRRDEPLRETLAGSGAAADRGMVIKCDVTDPSSVKRLFSQARDDLGRIDFLFNNAGIFGRSAPFEDFELSEWEAVVSTNLTGAFLCAREAFRVMKDQQPQGGRIVNNGSISAHAPRPRAAAYTATKHAMTGLTKSIALEGRPYDIACGQIDVGNAATEMTAVMTQGVLQADGTVNAEPVMAARHVADAVMYMAELPLEANVQFMTVMATKMPYVGRG